MGMGNKLADLIAERKTNVNAVAKKQAYRQLLYTH